MKSSKAGRPSKTKGTIHDRQYVAMKRFCLKYEDLSDLEFFKLAGETYGWGEADWFWFSQLQKIDSDKVINV